MIFGLNSTGGLLFIIIRLYSPPDHTVVDSTAPSLMEMYTAEPTDPDIAPNMQVGSASSQHMEERINLEIDPVGHIHLVLTLELVRCGDSRFSAKSAMLDIERSIPLGLAQVRP